MRHFGFVVLVLARLLPSLSAQASTTPELKSQARDASEGRTVCVLVDRNQLPDGVLPDLLRGLQRPFLLHDLPLERRDSKRRWHDAGSLHNDLRHSSAPCLAAHLADSLHLASLVAGESEGLARRVEIAVRVRIKAWSQMSINYVRRPGDPPLTPDQLIDPSGMLVEVAMCAPESVASNAALAWTPTQVWWRERPSSPSRAGEISGWMLGMAALQVVHRRLNLLPDSLELVFDSRGRNY